MTPRKRIEGALAEWHPHPKDTSSSLVPVVRNPTVDDEIADQFFADAPDMSAPVSPLVEDDVEETRQEIDEDVDEARRGAPDPLAIQARRQYLMRPVAAAVGVAALIGVGALLRVALTRDPHTSVSAAAATRAPELTAWRPPSPGDAPRTGATAAAAVEPPAPSAGDSDVNAQAAGDAKNESLDALEHGRLTQSVEAGERSVALDPTDADAWRILGAAYQRRGKYGEARRCFSTCSHVATRGDFGECSALLR